MYDPQSQKYLVSGYRKSLQEPVGGKMWPQRVLNSLSVCSYPCFHHLILCLPLVHRGGKGNFYNLRRFTVREGHFQTALCLGLPCVWCAKQMGQHIPGSRRDPAALIMSGCPHLWGWVGLPLLCCHLSLGLSGDGGGKLIDAFMLFSLHPAGFS